MLTAHNGKLAATARLTKTVAGPDSVLQTQWQDTFFRAPRTQVGRIRITVSGREVFVPVTAVAGLYAPNRATLRAEKAGFVLDVEGGDGHLGYSARIRFDGANVMERTLIGGESEQVEERTTYNTAPFPYE